MRNFRRLKLCLPAWMVLTLVVCVSHSSAATATVKDDAGFFSPAAVQKATADLQALQQQYHHTVVVETAASAPADIQARAGDAAGRTQAYNDYSDVRMASLGADIYVFATKSPGHLVIRAKNSEQRSGLTETGRQGLTNEMLAGFKAGQFDQALSKMCDGLRSTFANDGTAAAPRGPMPGPTASPQAQPPMTQGPGGGVSAPGLFGSLGCMGLVILLVVVFIVIRIIRRLFGGGRTGYPPAGYGGGYGPGQAPGGYGGGGGGMGRGIFGGLLGGLFGSYLGNRTFGQGPSQNSGGGLFGGGDAGSSAGGGDFGAAPPSNDAGGGGGDFGGGGGGGDSGSGASGGDF